MEEKRTSAFENGLIWFGAAVSIAEISTGTYFAPLGFSKGLLAILVGHVIGCVMLFFSGLIGGKVRKSAMETAKMSFGSKGGLLFSVLNIIQLVGWTAIMIFDGALAVNGILNIGNWIWCIIIGLLIVVWILIGIENLGKVNTVAMGALFALISDYTREAKKPIQATAASAVTYGVVSCWMYVIGMGAAIFTAESDIAQIMVKAGLGVAGLLIVVFSTVTTTFLDAYSAGISCESLSKKINGKIFAVAVTIIGTIGAILFPLDDITDFLYFIGSVFAPMIAIQIADFFILKRNSEKKAFSVQNLAVWLVGFIIYRILMNVDIIVGNTLPDMIITMNLCIAVAKLFGKLEDK